MSVLDSICETQIDVFSTVEDSRLDVLICPSDKLPADYLSLNELKRICFFVGVYEPVPHSLLVDAAKKVYEYVCSIPQFSDFSKGVLIPTPKDVALTNSDYDTLLVSHPLQIEDRNHSDFLLCVSFRVDVRSYYSLMKIVRSLYRATWEKRGFNLYGHPVLRWKSINDISRSIVIDQTTVARLGFKNMNYVDLDKSRLTDTMVSLSLYMNLVSRRGLAVNGIVKASERYWSRQRMQFG